MLLVMDLGNTNSVLGVYERPRAGLPKRSGNRSVDRYFGGSWPVRLKSSSYGIDSL